MSVSKEELERRLRRFAETFGRAGAKVTHQRAEIFREVAGSEEHPDPEAVYRQVRKRVTGISRDTVYRTLATLERAGLIRRTGALGGPARYDGNMERHHHFVCKVCGRVEDFASKALDDLPIPRAVEAFGRIEEAQVQVRGICTSCARQKTKGRRRSPA
jgi:Fur family transcriptional regulator, peroxide stress response regulator